MESKIVRVLTDSLNPTDYLKKIRKREKKLGNYIETNCPHVAMATKVNEISMYKDVVSATYCEDYKIKLTFKDGKAA